MDLTTWRDLGIAKMLEVAFTSTNEIQAKNVSAAATAGALTQQVAPIDIYRALWLRESEAQMLAESRKRYSQPIQQNRNEIQPQDDRRTSQGVPDSRWWRQRQSSRSRAQGWLGVLVAEPVRRTVQGDIQL